MKNQTISRLSKKFSTELESLNHKENLDSLIEVLETTPDPDPSELFLLESLYKLKEKLIITKSKLDKYIIDKRNSTTGNKLDELYSNSYSYGSSKLFED